MSADTMAGTPRVAATVRKNDLVRLDDGTVHTVDGTPSSSPGAIGGLTLIIRFVGGRVLRVGAGVLLDVERPE
ncbi:hypothetical protein ACODT4_44465 [Streptomyces sp. 2.9]|uniref:hypothetical protein n=1 Tax=Streptomyces tritrimontium TaxID=3406573 RepID=UPI003BB753F9